jgi:hypothetical protein
MTQTDDQSILRLNEPGIVIELDRRTADALGAFVEDALDEDEALASTETERRDVH